MCLRERESMCMSESMYESVHMCDVCVLESTRNCVHMYVYKK